jgi:hypothetical protein
VYEDPLIKLLNEKDKSDFHKTMSSNNEHFVSPTDEAVTKYRESFRQNFELNDTMSKFGGTFQYEPVGDKRSQSTIAGSSMIHGAGQSPHLEIMNTMN